MEKIHFPSDTKRKIKPNKELTQPQLLCPFCYLTTTQWFWVFLGAKSWPCSDFKIVQIIKCTSTVFVDNLKNISTNSLIYRYQFVGEIMADMLSIKEMIQCATLWIPKRMKKCNFYFYCILP